MSTGSDGGLDGGLPRGLEGIANFRDAGGALTADGRRVVTGRVFRSGHLSNATDADLGTLAALGIRTVVDLRTDLDFAHDGALRLPDEAIRVHLPMGDPSGSSGLREMIASRDHAALVERFGGGRAEAFMRNGAANLVTDPARGEQFGRFLRHVADLASRPAQACLVHCSAGKDRTGWAVSVLLLALGVPEHAVLEQYLASNVGRDERLAALPEPVSEALGPFIGVREAYLQASLDAVDERWGGLDSYLRDACGLGPTEREELEAAMLR